MVVKIVRGWLAHGPGQEKQSKAPEGSNFRWGSFTTLKLCDGHSQAILKRP